VAGSSISAKLGNGVLAMVNAAFPAGGSGKFLIRVGTRDVVPVTLTSPLGALTDIDDAITSAYGLSAKITTSSQIGASPLQALEIRADNAGDDVVIESAPSADIARSLGLGSAQGGIEVGAHSERRPRPSGYLAVLGDATSRMASLLSFAAIDRTSGTGTPLTSLTLAGGPDGFNVLGAQVTFPVNSGTLSRGSAASGDSLLNVRENLLAIAGGINAAQTRWRAELHGYRLALLPRFGASNSGTGYSLHGAPSAWDLGVTGKLFDPSLTAAQRAADALVGGSNGHPPQLAEYQDAFKALEQKVDLFNLMVLPRSHDDPERRQEIWGPASTFCDSRRAFLLMDASQAATGVEQVLAEVATLRVGVVKDHVGLYWPPLNVAAGGGLRRKIDPSGSIAGLMSRIDSSRGVWKAPAGLEADLRGILGVSVLMSDPENGLLNPQAINAIRSFPNGVVSWGARTLDGFDNSGNDDYKYVPVRRFALFLEESLFRGLKFAVFEPNDEQLWGQIRLAAGAFMNNLFRQGAFAGKTTRDAYFVKVDSETTTQNDINLGIVNVLVGFAPLKPAEFVVITIRQQAGQVQV
jgi:hypothetical protein